MIKVAINSCYGGFSLSEAAIVRLKEKGISNFLNYTQSKDQGRSDPRLIETIEELGPAVASGRFARLKIVEVPNNVVWHIEEYDGWEHVAEQHRTWG